MARVSLDQRIDHFLAWPFWRHLAVVAALAVIATLRWYECTLASEPMVDEETYLDAFELYAAGKSPYSIASYLYTPLFAWAGSLLLTLGGQGFTIVVIRSLSLIGLAMTAWCSFLWVSMSWTTRFVFAALFVGLAPAARGGLCAGNIAYAAIGVILLALLLWPRGSMLNRTVPTGLALGTTIAFKPLAPLALVCLFFHRPREGGIRHFVAAAVAGGTALALSLPLLSQLGEMAAQPIMRLNYIRSFSLHRMLALLGIELSPAVVMVIAAIAIAVLIRLRPLGHSQLIAIAGTTSALITPIIWDHTMTLTLPVVAMALALAHERWRDAPTALRKRKLYALIFVTLGALAVLFSGGYGALELFSEPVQLAFLMVPYFAPVVLLVYAFRSAAVLRRSG